MLAAISQGMIARDYDHGFGADVVTVLPCHLDMYGKIGRQK
jgi:hypothetical protein